MTRPIPNPGTTDRLDGREEHEPTRRVPMTYRAARPSRTLPRRRAGDTPEEHPTPARLPPDDRPAEWPRDVGRQENSTSHAIGEPSQRPGSGPRETGRRRVGATVTNDPAGAADGPERHPATTLHQHNEHHPKARGTRTTNRLRKRTSSRTFVQGQRRSESSRSPPHDRECGAPERAQSSTIGTRRTNEKPPSRKRPERDEIHP